MDEQAILTCLQKSWSLNTSSKWTPANPACGQCSVTALVINDHFGGEILKTQTADGQWHFYNRMHGRRFDFTASQFQTAIEYSDILSNRDEAFADTNESQYQALRSAFLTATETIFI